MENAGQPGESLQGDDGFLSIIFQAYYPKEPSDLSKHQGYFSVTDYTLIRVGEDKFIDYSTTDHCVQGPSGWTFAEPLWDRDD